jgi:hypothetical protein
MPLPIILLVLAAAGLLLAAAGTVALRAIGARPGPARRLAGPAERKVGEVLRGDEAAGRPVRIAGRIRCREPLVAAGGERLVAYHRDVEVRIGRRWRTIERLRETRSFELWDHDGSTELDPSRAAEPLIAIPKVWRGDPAVLEEPHASVVERLAARHGPIREARASTRTINVTDRLLVLARPVAGEDGQVRLEPPDGGYLITNLALPEAMRLLGGRHRRTAAGAVIAQGLGAGLVAVGGIGAFVVTLAGR